MPKLTPEQRDLLNHLTLDDALNDREWGKRPEDFSEYLQFDRTVARALKRASAEDKVALVDAVCDYLLAGAVPNDEEYDNMPAAAAFATEHMIQTHEKTLPNLYLTKFKQHVAGKLAGRGESK